MATDDETPDANPPEAEAAVTCSACRGTGTVISNLGGSPHEVECPWCDGGGVRLPDHDAQARHRGGVKAEAPPSTDDEPAA